MVQYLKADKPPPVIQSSNVLAVINARIFPTQILETESECEYFFQLKEVIISNILVPGYFYGV